MIASVPAAVVAAGVALAIRAVAGGGGGPPAIAEGEWRPSPSREFAPSAWHGTIHKLDERHYRLQFMTAPFGTAPSQDYARNDGVYELRQSGDGWHLVGDTSDVDGWCCGQFGHSEFEVTDAGELHQLEADWGDRPGHYVTRYGPWWYERMGPLPARE